MKRLHYLVTLFWVLMLAFAVCRVGFMLYNAAFWPGAADPSLTGFAGSHWLLDMGTVIFHGAVTHDLVVVGACLALPALLTACGVERLRLWLTPYYIVIAVAVGVIVVGDAVMYEFWQFKLSRVVLAYAAYPEGTTSSVSPAFLFTRVGTGILLMVVIAATCIILTPKRAKIREDWRKVPRLRRTALHLRSRAVTIAITVAAYAFAATATGVGSAYKSDRIFLNHAAVNPVYGFFSSFSLHDYADRYDYLAEADRKATMEGLYEGNGTGATVLADSLLHTDRPDVLVVLVESFGSEFVTSLGGQMGTTPDGRREDVDRELERLIPEGVFWTNYYSNSFRTDRGVVSTFCGWPAYTDIGLMTHRETHAQLPSLPRSLGRAGYETTYMYPGPTTNMGKGDFLRGVGFGTILDKGAFTDAELDSPWGVHDLTSARKVAAIMGQRDEAAKPRLFVYQTVSSHEPWDVPYTRFNDKVQNAFAYTDAAIGTLIDSLKASPAWDNLLVVIIPDHGHLYNVGPTDAADVHAKSTGKAHRQAFDDPEFFHSPMLWLGGALRGPRTIDVLMNQSDLCATLLGQLGIDHSDYVWSRDVLSTSYRNPFIYSTYPAGMLYRDASGTTLYDVSANAMILQHDAGGERRYGPHAASSKSGAQRLQRAKAILQTTYDGLPALRTE